MDNTLKKTPKPLHTHPDTTNKCKIFKPTMHYGKETAWQTDGEETHMAVPNANGTGVSPVIALYWLFCAGLWHSHRHPLAPHPEISCPTGCQSVPLLRCRDDQYAALVLWTTPSIPSENILSFTGSKRVMLNKMFP